MKICVVTLAEKGGMIHYASQLSQALAKYHQVHLIVSDKAEIEDLEDVNMVKIPVPMEYMSSKLFSFLTLKRTINSLKPDLVHFTSTHPWLIAVAPLLSCPITATIHDVKMHRGEWNPIWAFSQRVLINSSKKVFVHGPVAQKELIESGTPLEKISVVPHGDYSFFTQFEHEKMEEEDNILFFGRILEYKGLEYLIRAKNFLKDEYPGLKLIIAGEGDIGPYLELINDKDGFELHNRFIPDEEVANFFQRSKMVVLPYKEGSQSGIIPIAYSFKKPVLSTRVGDIPEMVDDGITGILVPPCDCTALVGGIRKLISHDQLRKKMGENGYNKLMIENSWQKIAEHTTDSYREVMSHANP
ncbi:MAG TPA: glycosyltransferase family 4 protein [Methanobacteriaceae archaeon]|nr:glycosyltransferase family 4 protein [Methanobacteriaceae archaeon]